MKGKIALAFLCIILSVLCFASCGGEQHSHVLSNPIKENKIDATCESVGSYDEVIYCLECGEEIKRVSKTTEKLEHTPSDWIVDTASTCKTEGAKHKECTVCHVTLETGKLDNLAEHFPAKAVVENEKDASCTAVGFYDEVVYCSVCETELSRVRVEISPTDHTPGDWITDIEATCKTEGTKHKECTECHDILETGNIDKLTKHILSEPVRENEVDSSCVDLGSYDEVVYCSVCEIEWSRVCVEISMKDHIPGAWIIDKEATCAAEGIKHKECIVCNGEIDICNIPKKEHSLSDWIIDKPASCIETGERHKECTECKTVFETDVIDPLISHVPADAVTENLVDSSCHYFGSYDEVVYCSVCGGELSRIKKEIEKKPHTQSDWIVDVEATCTEDGAKHIECLVCLENIVTEAIKSPGHHTNGEPIIQNRIDPTCYEEGSYDEVVNCSVCNDEISRIQKQLPKLEHTPSDWIVDLYATCKSDGKMHKECTVCCKTLDTQWINKLSHTLGEAVEESFNPATCTDNGYYYEVVYCTACHDEISREYVVVSATGVHTPASYEIPQVSPTCTSVGVTTVVTTCSICYQELSRENKEVPMKDHTPLSSVEENRVDPTCLDEGYYHEVIYCKYCHGELSRTTKNIEKNPHTQSDVIVENFVESSCTVAGSYDEVVYCTACDSELSRETKAIEKQDHALGDWIVVTEPTCSAEGYKYRICTKCLTLSENVFIERLNHSFENHRCAVCEAYEVPFITYDISLNLDGSIIANLYQTNNGLYELYILGEGEMVIAPWSSYAPYITILNIDEGITSIKSGAFYGFTRLQEVTIPSSIVTIGDKAFCGCTALTSIHYLAKEVDDFKDYNDIFRNAGQNSTGITVFIGSTVTKIPDHLFHPDTLGEAPKIKQIIFEDESACKTIGEYSFALLSHITEIYIPKSVEKIGYSAFAGCSSLKMIDLPFVGASINGISAGEQTLFGYIFGRLSYSGTTATKQYYADNASSFATYYIPDGLSTVTIRGGCVFYGSFYNCSNVKSVTLSENINTIGNMTFAGCTQLELVSLPCADSRSFSALFNTIPESLIAVTVTGEHLSDGYFSYTDIGAKIILNDTITCIGDEAFYLPDGSSTLTEIVIPNSVITIGSRAFQYSGLLKINIPDSVVSIGSYAFSGCGNLSEVHIGNGVESIGISAFSNCKKLSELTVGNNVKTVGSAAFSNCSSLTYCNLPANITSIGSGIFSGCSSLKSVVLPFVGADLRQDGARENYLFGYFFGKEKYSGGVATKQQYYAGEDAPVITYYIPATLRSVTVLGGNISAGAFYNCSGLTNLSIKGTGVIGARAFYNCENISNIFIGCSVTKIGDSAFYGCNADKVVYYEGNEDWADAITSDKASITKATYYYYSEEKPLESGNRWHYDENGNVTVW